MRLKRTVLILVSVLLLCSIALGFSGCAVVVSATADLMEGITPRTSGEPGTVTPESAAKAAGFAVRLFRQSSEAGENTLVSPLSVLAALAMTANGARGETKAQMESVLGMSTEELNEFFDAYLKSLPNGEKYRLSPANSVWFTSDARFTVNRDFLQTNADYYGADAYKAPFDETTLNDINGWVKRKTDGMIPSILDRIPGNAVMYLINALAFEAEWEKVYKEDNVQEGVFTREDGTEENVEFMYATEEQYLDDGRATGFVKYYSGRQYAFVALLPNEGISVAEYVASLDGEALLKLLSNPTDTKVKTSIPKMETEYSTEMSAVLKEMGMPAAFDAGQADFSGLGTSTSGPIFIGRVLHKTFISVGEKGTRAGAATAVEMLDKAIHYEPDDMPEVYLDRPFVYMLIDTATNIPFFLGTMMDVNG